MRTTTGIFKCHEHRVKINSLKDRLTLVPFGDVHRFAPLCNVERWHESLDRMKSLENPIFLGMGDYDDLMSASERAIINNPKIHESTRETLEDFADSKTYELAQELDFMRGRLIGLVGGNHYFEYQTGITSDQKLCEHLDCPFLGVSTIIRLVLCYGKKTASIDIWAHHGKGASRLIGGSINRVEQMREAMHADVYMMGHDHQRAAVPVDTLQPGTTRCGKFGVNRRTQWLCRTGSFLNAYEDGKAGYIVDACRGPVNHGHIELELSMRREEVREGKERKVKLDTVSIEINARI